MLANETPKCVIKSDTPQSLMTNTPQGPRSSAKRWTSPQARTPGKSFHSPTGPGYRPPTTPTARSNQDGSDAGRQPLSTGNYQILKR